MDTKGAAFTAGAIYLGIVDRARNILSRNCEEKPKQRYVCSVIHIYHVIKESY